MSLLVGSLILFFAFFCYVQCGTNVATHEDSRSLDQGQNHYDVQSQLQSALVPKSQHFKSLPQIKVNPNEIRRRRRHAFPVKDNNLPVGISWNHRFSIEEYVRSSLTSETAYLWEDNTKRLQNIFQNEVVFNFLSPSGFRMSIPANSINMKIIDFRVKMNQAFQSNNDGGHFAPQSYKNNAMWVYEVPQMRLKRGDQVHYWMRLVLGNEAFDTVVKGYLEITKGDPHTYLEPISFKPPALVLTGDPSPTKGAVKTPFSWEHQFNINFTYSDAFTKESASRWYEHAEFVKHFLEKHIIFKFMSPSGLVITVPDNSITITDFQIKLNDKFRDNNLGHFSLSTSKRDNMWTYNIPQLQVQQGDTVYYRMRVKRAKDGFDAIVLGSLKIKQGYPHVEVSLTTIAPYQFIQTRPNNLYTSSVVVRPQSPVPVSSGSGQSPLQPGVDRFGESDNNGGQLVGTDRLGEPEGSGSRPTGTQSQNNGATNFNWEHNFVSFNLNNTQEAGLTQNSANWAMQIDDYFKKTLRRKITFEFSNPTGLKIIISGDDDNFKILTFNVKLNEEFNEFGDGSLQAYVSKLNDGRWSYYYPSLKLKQGDNVHYWMKVTFNKERWLYLVKGVLEFPRGDPHPSNNMNPILITSSYPQSTTSKTYLVPTTKRIPAVAGQSVKWDHKYSANRTNSGGSALTTTEKERLINMYRKDMDFKFLNPSGLRLLFSANNKEFRLLAINTKLNEYFDSLEPGHYIANVSRARDGRIDYYFPNLKIKLGDTLHYWMRVILGAEMTDYIVKGELRLIQGDPHLGGQVPDVPPPSIWSQARPLPTGAPPPVTRPPVTQPPTSIPSAPISTKPPQDTTTPEVEPLQRFTPQPSLQGPAPLPLQLRQTEPFAVPAERSQNFPVSGA